MVSEKAISGSWDDWALPGWSHVVVPGNREDIGAYSFFVDAHITLPGVWITRSRSDFPIHHGRKMTSMEQSF